MSTAIAILLGALLAVIPAAWLLACVGTHLYRRRPRGVPPALRVGSSAAVFCRREL